ncbi:MAG: DNA repair protein RecN, partial [Clostridia bacterium]|nr:DNA repair protein RecN [Clostridia bacterium]
KGSEKGSISLLLEKSAQALSQISDVVAEFEEYAETLREFKYKIDDIAEEVYAVAEDMDSDPTESLNKIESRLDKISKIKRKYGLTIADVLEFREKSASELETLKNSDDVLKKLEKQENELYRAALDIAEKLHSIREKSAEEISHSVKETLEFLDMPSVVFYADIKVEKNDGRTVLYSDGEDSVEFYISANRGAEPQPLSKIASGGELARIMLALKSVIANRDGTSTVVFDEIDAGVSGKTARKIGIKLLQLSKKTQIFCVTHSAQIASLADCHLLIRKRTVGDKTETELELLSEDGRISELSRILGGINVTESQRRAAVDMLNERKLY